MSSADWKLDSAELASKFNERTKAIVLNSPNNPLGKVIPLALLWLALKAAGVLQLTQLRLQCSSGSTFLDTREIGALGATHSALTILVVLSLTFCASMVLPC